MRAIVLSNALSTCLFLASAGIATPQEPSAPSPGGTIERLDPALDALLAADSMVEKVAGGFQFIEGPLWVGSGADGYLLFSDIPANKIYRWTASAGANVFLEPVMAPDAKTGGTGGSNGLALDPDGRVVLFEHGNRQVSRLEADGRRTVLADRYEGKRLNSPNDGVFHRDGSLYFTDPPYGLAGQDQDPNKELVSNGIFRCCPMAPCGCSTTSRLAPTASACRPINARYMSPTRRRRRTSCGWPTRSPPTARSAPEGYSVTPTPPPHPAFPTA